MRILEMFLEVVLTFSDLRWSQFRDDSILKCVKALRKFREGRDLEEILSDKKISSGIEKVLELLQEFSSNSSKEEIERLMEALVMFTKAPAPCKMSMIALARVVLGRKEAKG